ncbi:MAG: DNA internalization-related competence protein ComEC/Rec2 [Proteobacteria bacterium]|nr:DNA internalization-related competence protein ComEC/Rec2 [Pseudomonadota bacterium]
MRFALIGYGLGIFAGAFVATPEATHLYAYLGQGLGLALVLLLALRWRRLLPTKRVIPVLLMGFGATLGFLWHMSWASSILHRQLPESLEGINMLVTGVVVSLPQRNAIAQQFKFRIHQSDHQFSQRVILLNYYGEASIRGGQRWQFLVRLNQAHGFANPASFDYEAWLFQQAITAKGYVRTSADNQLLAARSLSLTTLRSQLRSRVQAAVADLAHGGIILALILGDRSEISQASWQQLTDAGINHLFVISGLHIGLIALAVFALADKLIRLLPATLLRLPAQKFGAILAILAAVAYGLLAGFTLPTQRAMIMIVVFMLGYLANRPLAISIRYLLALALVMTLNPLAVVSAGFWFSFIAVAALLLCLDLPRRDGHEASTGSRIIHRYIKPQLIVFVALALPLIFWTQQLPLLSPLINVFAIPLVALFVVPLCLLALLFLFINGALAQGLMFTADATLAAFFGFVEWILAVVGSGAVVHPAAPSLPIMVVLSFAALLLLLPKGVGNRCLAFALCLPLFSPAPDKFEPARLKLHFLDVGQGLAVVVQSRHHVLIYDTGANLSPEFNIGSAVIAPFLKQSGIGRVDLVVISHADNDHAGGLSGLMENVEIGAIISSDVSLGATMAIDACHEYDAWTWDQVEFQFLGAYAEAASNNDNSCVLQIAVGRHRILLPGDIERFSERQLAINYGDTLRSTILAAPHHGSKTSSSYAFIKMVDPEVVVFSAGYRNSFGHPHPEIVARYRRAGARVLNTSDTGMISFSFDTESAAMVTSLYRQQRPRYWR